MKYVALLSGGKDSCYNLLHCHKNGHELIAAASLGPGPGKEELDSYMYQTVGQDAIELVARALDVPLIRRVIQGTAIEQGPEYGKREFGAQSAVDGDETEDMYELLSEVKVRFPEVRGVSAGAILSDYQRVRVEHVCKRLSLTPLCYLWQRDQAELLSEMISAGLKAVLIKVAGIGLRVAHLERTLDEMQPTLSALSSQYGLHICGEGGEYETLTLDSPMFKKKITLLSTEPVILSDNKFATVAYLRVKEATLEAKELDVNFDLPIPQLITPEFEVYAGKIQSACREEWTDSHQEDARLLNVKVPSPPTVQRSGKWLSFGNITAAQDSGTHDTLEDEALSCFSVLRDLLSEHLLHFSNIATMHVYIANMSDFSRVNAVYSNFFATSPPARACVAVDLPSPLRLVLECIVYKETSAQDRRALHVQGLSYWAPANIGPYSQAIVAGNHIFISGQIGMSPRSLSLPSPRSIALEAALASQHTERILDALRSGSGGGWTGHAMLNIFWYSRIVDALAVQRCTESDVPSLHVVVRDLPKGALVEKQVLYHTGNMDEDESASSHDISYSHGSVQLSQKRFSIDTARLGLSAAAVICGITPLAWNAMAYEIKERLQDDGICTGSLLVRWFYSRDESVPPSSFFTTLFEGDMPALTYLPSRSILSRGVDTWHFAMVIVSCSS